MTTPEPEFTEVNGERRRIGWKPNAGPQTQFMRFGGYECLYGGQAGGGKSQGLLAAATRYLHLPNYTGIIFRRTMPDLKKYLIEQSRQMVPLSCPTARYNGNDYCWTVPGGGRLFFSHLEHEHDKQSHTGAEYQFIGWDELVTFTQTQYEYLLSRGRGSTGIPVFHRSTTNPGGAEGDWVFRRWGPWLDPDSMVKAKPGEPLWYINTDDGPIWVPRGTPNSFSRVFIPAKLSDNPHLTGTNYEMTLTGLDPVERARLRDGNWLVRPKAGDYFKREWVAGRGGEKLIDAAPEGVRWYRYWDRAATEPSKANPNPDWTVGVKLGVIPTIKKFVIGNVKRFRKSSAGVEAAILETAIADGPEVEIGIEQDPGSAGVAEAEAYVRLLAQFIVKKYPVSKAKVTRFRPFSAQAEQGNVLVVRGEWNGALFDEMEALTDPPDRAWHDDQCDGVSGAYNVASGGPSPFWFLAI